MSLHGHTKPVNWLMDLGTFWQQFLHRLPFATPIVLIYLYSYTCRHKGTCTWARTFFFFPVCKHTPYTKLFVTVETEQCLGVFGSCGTSIVPGGACVLCNLSPIVHMTELNPGTRYNYVVTQSFSVNHLPYLSHHFSASAWVAAQVESLLGLWGESRVRDREGKHGKGQILYNHAVYVWKQDFRSSWTCVPTGSCGDLCLCLHMLYFEVEGGAIIMAPRVHHMSLRIPSPQAAAAAAVAAAAHH